jgi:hypothetical protein
MNMYKPLQEKIRGVENGNKNEETHPLLYPGFT